MSAGRTKPSVDDKTGRLTPGAHLRAEIERLGLDQVAVSKATGVSRQSINNIVNGRQPISRAMAARLGRLTGRGSDYWLGASFSGDGAARLKTAVRPCGVLVDHQIVRAIKDGVIVIDPFTAGNVRAAAIDLTVAKGLMLTAGAGVFSTHVLQLEPGFKDRVGIYLFNPGNVPVRLRGGETVLRLEIVRLDTTPTAKITTANR